MQNEHGFKIWEILGAPEPKCYPKKMEKKDPRIETYEAFWRHYLAEHSHKTTKRLHILGTTLGLALAAVLLYEKQPAWLPLCLVVAYGLAWYSHFFIERNRPATFKYPLWSFISDFRMAYLYLRGKL